mmetsp:Transcript_28375/g.55540  ORF Transcript_28375/g.55540 Transcript_28375/m.55540 type:complete len:211 (-) Transcript_28375:1018-1650(-)
MPPRNSSLTIFFKISTFSFSSSPAPGTLPAGDEGLEPDPPPGFIDAPTGLSSGGPEIDSLASPPTALRGTGRDGDGEASPPPSPPGAAETERRVSLPEAISGFVSPPSSSSSTSSPSGAVPCLSGLFSAFPPPAMRAFCASLSSLFCFLSFACWTRNLARTYFSWAREAKKGTIVSMNTRLISSIRNKAISSSRSFWMSLEKNAIQNRGR